MTFSIAVRESMGKTLLGQRNSSGFIRIDPLGEPHRGLSGAGASRPDHTGGKGAEIKPYGAPFSRI
jgi:hypothetical protein